MAEKSRYTLFKKIAHGGMAEVFIGRQEGEDGFQRICCLKRIHPQHAQDEQFLTMFRDEAHICKMLQHANIVRVEGFEEVEGSFAIVMELIAGADVRTILSECEKKGKKLSIPMIVYIIAEAARGLQYAHTKKDDITERPLGIVHRDISPQNILISFNGETKVTDFGIADAKNKSEQTKSGVVKGKYSYMSPEQIAGETVDHRSDVFALAIVLWEMLAMRRLFVGQSDAMTIQLVSECKITRDISTLNNQVGDDLKSIIYRGLHKDRNLRYPSAGDMEKDLRRFLNRKYPNFTPDELSEFISTLLDEKLKNFQEIIKETLKQKPTVQTKKELKIEPNKTPTSQGIAPLKTNLTTLDKKPLEVPKPPQPLQTFKSKKNEALKEEFAVLKPSQNIKYDVPLAKKKLFLASGLFILLVSLIFFGLRAYTRSHTSGVIELYIIPNIVRVYLDNQPLNKENYMTTPIRLTKLARGLHTLQISRTGFTTKKLEVFIESNNPLKREVVLNPEMKMSPIRVSLYSQAKRKVQIEVDDGVFSGQVDSNSVVNIENITYGKSHVLKVAELDITCRFIPKSTHWGNPFMIRINLDTKKCRL